MSSSTIAKMANGESVTLTVIEHMCDKLECIIQYVLERVRINSEKLPEEKEH